jgi:hypothetical protein
MAELPADLSPELRERYEATQRKREALQSARESRSVRLVPRFEIPAAWVETDEQRDARLERERVAAERAERERVQAARARRVERLRALRIPLAAADENALIDGTLDLRFGTSIVELAAWLEDENAEPWFVLCGGYVTSADLDRLYASHFGDEVETWRKERDKRDLLVIDDAGARLENVERVTTALLDLADFRRGEGHHTVLIANVVVSKLRERYAEPRLWSRLGQAGAMRVRGDGGTDARKAGAR